MTPNQIREAAQFLMDANAARRREPDLPDGLKPKTEAEAQAIWSAIFAANAKPVVGWKIGATASAAQQAMGLSGPFVGFLTADMLDKNGVTYKHGDMLGPIVESEYAFRMAADLPESERPHFEYLSTASESFARYADARANRRDPFFIQPAGGADVCNIPVPVRRTDAE